MYNFSFESEGVTTYMVYELNNEEVLDTLSLGMLTNNKIANVSPVLFTQMDDKKYLKYNISSKVPMDQFFTGIITKHRLLTVFSSITSALLAAEEYMLMPSSFLLDSRYIYVDVSSCEASLVCMPFIEQDSMQVNVVNFFKQTMFSTQLDQTENCDYLAKIINFLNSSPNMSLVEFKDLIDELLGKKVEAEPVQEKQAPLQRQMLVRQTNTSIETESAPSMAKPPQVNMPQANAPVPPQANAPMPVPPAQPAQPVVNAGFEIPGGNKVVSNAKPEKKHKEKKPKEKKEKVKKEKKSWFSFGKSKAEKNGNAVQQSFTVPGAPMQPQQPVQQPMQQQPYAPAFNQNAANQQMQPAMNSSRPNFGETTVLGQESAGETTVLGQVQMQNRPHTAYLVRSSNQEKIVINKPNFRIGKERTYVDYFISDNTAISRSHASIITRNNQYYVMDTNSTNHTYLNNEMLTSNMEVELTNGALVRLANEEFKFNID